jgi:hypothetical protein
VAETTAEVIYSGVDVAAVTHATSASDDVARAAEVALFALYAGHIYADLGRKSWAVEFSSALAGLDDNRTDTDWDAFTGSNEVMGVRVDQRVEPSAARVGFGAWLFHGDEIRPGFFLLTNQKHWRLKVHLRGRDRHRGNHYFATSVALLLHHLLRENAQDRAQRDRLIQAAGLVADLHRQGSLILPIRWTQAVSFAIERAW